MCLLNKVLRIKVAMSFGIVSQRLNLDIGQSSSMAPENTHQGEKLLLYLRKLMATPWNFILLFSTSEVLGFQN